MKKSGKIIITLLTLILISVLVFGGYFIWKSNNKVDEQKSNNAVMSNEEAYELGKNMYFKIVNFSYEEGEFNTEDGMAEILNISELKELTTEKVFKTYLTATEAAVEEADDGSYWCIGGRGSDISYLDYWTIKVINISENEINYEVTESYIKDPENYGKNINELNNDELENKTNKFTLVKENNVWKVSEFTYPR